MILDQNLARRLNRAAFASYHDEKNYKVGDDIDQQEIDAMFEAERIWLEKPKEA